MNKFYFLFLIFSCIFTSLNAQFCSCGFGGAELVCTVNSGQNCDAFCPANGFENTGDDEGYSDNACQNSNAAMPVEMAYFRAEVKGQSVQLSWRTIMELNNEGFHVQRSLDGIEFRSIEFIKGYGTTEVAQDYSFIDRDLQAGFVYHYRLMQVDLDGQFEYTNQMILAIKGKDLNVGELFPNPANGGAVQVYVTATEEGQQPVVVTDLAGRELQREQLRVQDGFNVLTLDVANLPFGTYLVRIGSGAEVAHRRLVVQ